MLALLACAPAAQAAEYRRPTPQQLEAIRRWLCPHGGSPVKGMPGRCDPGVTSWDRGLPPTNRNQQPCPEGTEPVRARFNPGVVRCLPKGESVAP
ncbi:hypothetical protein IAI18_19515 [Acetobacteraceae bacterium H6797]|nr:hypothetical protein [Acetobacteraceae bacterium H6797]